MPGTCLLSGLSCPVLWIAVARFWSVTFRIDQSNLDSLQKIFFISRCYPAKPISSNFIVHHKNLADDISRAWYTLITTAPLASRSQKYNTNMTSQS